LKESLLGHVKNMPTAFKDPSWMLALPLLHIVFDLCKPFEELREDFSHGAKKPVWWGIAEIEYEVKKYMNIQYYKPM